MNSVPGRWFDTLSVLSPFGESGACFSYTQPSLENRGVPL
jgi:hypothetical protein